MMQSNVHPKQFVGRVIILILDGFGVGQMPDFPSEDAGANTLANVDAAEGPLELTNLAKLGLGYLTSVAGVEQVPIPIAAYGKCALRHPGADTYMGHQELLGGGLDKVDLRLLSEIRANVIETLIRAGHVCTDYKEGLSPLLVDGCVLIADNIEARPRLNINVTASQDEISFEKLLEIGELVRSCVPVPRVIVVGGKGFGIKEIIANVREKELGQIGVDTPALGVYDDNYMVRHLGVDFTVDMQLPTKAVAAGYPVILLGKAADVVLCKGAIAEPIISTHLVFERMFNFLDQIESGLLVVNIQETDLSGHEEDTERYAQVLKLVDSLIPDLVSRLKLEDVLFITGDHGNDPTIGHSQHTREYTPALVFGGKIKPISLGLRTSLADIGATAADLMGVLPLGSGNSFLSEVLCS